MVILYQRNFKKNKKISIIKKEEDNDPTIQIIKSIIDREEKNHQNREHQEKLKNIIMF